MSTAALAVNPASDLEERRKGIGGSDLAVLLGLSPYKTALDLWMEKQGLWVDEFRSEAAHWGTVMEPVLAAEYSTRFHVPVARTEPAFGPYLLYPEHNVVDMPGTGPRHLLGTLVHPEHPWARGHVDGIGLSADLSPSHVCEFKTADLRLGAHWGDEDTDQIPEAYLCQVQWYLMLTELEVAHVAALIGGNRFRRYIVERDQHLIDLMLERASIFWEMVLQGDPPAPAPGEQGKQSLSRLYAVGAKGKEISATAELHELVLELHQLREQGKDLKERQTTLENDIKAIMADAVRLNVGPKSYISWSNNKSSIETDWEAAFRALAGKVSGSEKLAAAAIAAHTTTKPGPRVFRCQGLDKLIER